LNYFYVKRAFGGVVLLIGSSVTRSSTKLKMMNCSMSSCSTLQSKIFGLRIRILLITLHQTWNRILACTGAIIQYHQACKPSGADYCCYSNNRSWWWSWDSGCYERQNSQAKDLFSHNKKSTLVDFSKKFYDILVFLTCDVDLVSH
jgi:hypothetical protein